ncbi:hypothetical protein DFH09DRAFT_1274411 [Mycena vulgaris]|nr:hypothetical protein DFH09DRAFT_1274411 [Mycena vulgaris]
MGMIAQKYSEPTPLPDPEGYTETGQDALWPYEKGEKLPTAEDIVDNILVTLKTRPRFGATTVMDQCSYDGAVRRMSLLAGNRGRPPALYYDPITPYASAKLVQETMVDSSRLVLQDTAVQVLRRYFPDGVIPEEPENCGRDISNVSVLQIPRIFHGMNSFTAGNGDHVTITDPTMTTAASPLSRGGSRLTGVSPIDHYLEISDGIATQNMKRRHIMINGGTFIINVPRFNERRHLPF